MAQVSQSNITSGRGLSTYALAVQSAHNILLHVVVVHVVLLLLALFFLLLGPGLALLALGAVGLCADILHLIVRLLLGSSDELLDSSLAARLLGL